jgi:ABC-type glycerol-3-phosphate transport system permease component
MADESKRAGPGHTRRRGGFVAAVSTYALLTVGAVTMLIPVVWMLSTSPKRPDLVSAIPPGFTPGAQW